MDEIVDPIRNCSLAVDADSTDFSDTSTKFNQPTVLSFNVITNELTSKTQERFDIPQQTAFLQQPISAEKFNTNITSTNEFANAATAIKKPSYLNLACCVNGYSYLTTYDSKIRQNINNSREVSPIRPGSNIIQHCKGLGNTFTSPCMKNTTGKQSYKQNKGYAMENQSKISVDSDNTITTVPNGKYLKENNCKSSNIVTTIDETDQTSKTFIQQRVERLYGIEAISKGFYSPKTSRSPQQEKPVLCERSSNSVKLNTHSNKIKEDNNMMNESRSLENIGNKDLPVFRHLRPEFRAQLPINQNKLTEDNIRVLNLENSNALQSCNLSNNLSDNKPEFNTKTTSLNNLNKTNNMVFNNLNNVKISDADIISNYGNIKDTSLQSTSNMKTELKNTNTITQVNIENKSNGTNILDGKYFLELLKGEQCRLLCLASTAEVEIEKLSKNVDISEDILGFLRSAAGKARLLVSQKMKQFEGLCLKNLNPESGDKFLTTLSDLQGFWDMVKLQVDDIDSIFKEIELLKENDWKKLDDSVCLVPSGSKLTRRPIIPSNSKNRKINPKDILATEAKAVNGNKSNTSLAAQKREIQRKQLMDLKRKNKIALSAQQENNENTNEIIVNEFAS